MQHLIFTADPARDLDPVLQQICPSGIFLLTDRNTSAECLPLLHQSRYLAKACHINIEAGDANKNLESLSHVWSRLSAEGATRHSVLVNLGGGMVTDLGGFAAATFKRGIRFINIPTTVLGAVDAAVGGKTGINFAGLKNEIGAFSMASKVIVSACFYATLPPTELLSGYGEVLKHALLQSDSALHQALAYDISGTDPRHMLPILRQSVQVKQDIVARDPDEQGLRRALNLGHTAAHAFESLAMERHRPLPHGVAVAHGLIVDLVLSHLRLGFPSRLLHEVADYVKAHYPAPQFDCADYDRLIGFMSHDKKNLTPSEINFTLLIEPGDPALDCIVSPDEITAALDITRDLLGT